MSAQKGEQLPRQQPPQKKRTRSCDQAYEGVSRDNLEPTATQQSAHKLLGSTFYLRSSPTCQPSNTHCHEKKGKEKRITWGNSNTRQHKSNVNKITRTTNFRRSTEYTLHSHTRTAHFTYNGILWCHTVTHVPSKQHASSREERGGNKKNRGNSITSQHFTPNL